MPVLVRAFRRQANAQASVRHDRPSNLSRLSEDQLTTERDLDADILLVEDDPNDAELVRRAL
jgi:hypothetical protein